MFSKKTPNQRLMNYKKMCNDCIGSNAHKDDWSTYAVTAALITRCCSFYTSSNCRNKTKRMRMNSWYKKNVNENEIICSSSQVIFGINSIAKWADARFVVSLMSRYIFCLFFVSFSKDTEIEITKSNSFRSCWKTLTTAGYINYKFINARAFSQSLAIVVLGRNVK